jgi:hypothetical protein
MKVGDPVKIYKCPEWFNSGGIGVITGQDPNDGSFRVNDYNEVADFDSYVKPENLEVLSFDKPKKKVVDDPVMFSLLCLSLIINIMLGYMII